MDEQLEISKIIQEKKTMETDVVKRIAKLK